MKTLLNKRWNKWTELTNRLTIYYDIYIQQYMWYISVVTVDRYTMFYCTPANWNIFYAIIKCQSPPVYNIYR